MLFFSDQSGQVSLNQSCEMLGKEAITGSMGTICHEYAFTIFFSFSCSRTGSIRLLRTTPRYIFSSSFLENTCLCKINEFGNAREVQVIMRIFLTNHLQTTFIKFNKPWTMMSGDALLNNQKPSDWSCQEIDSSELEAAWEKNSPTLKVRLISQNYENEKFCLSGRWHHHTLYKTYNSVSCNWE